MISIKYNDILKIKNLKMYPSYETNDFATLFLRLALLHNGLR